MKKRGMTMRAVDLKPFEIIDRDPDHGFPLFGSTRIMAVSVYTLGRLFSDISRHLDQDQQKAVFTRVGFEVGMAQAVTLSDRYHFENREEWFRAGSSLRTMIGYSVETLTDVSATSRGNIASFSGTWKCSFESVAYGNTPGREGGNVHSINPVCLILSSIISGYASVVCGRVVYVRETTCAAQGNPVCSFEGRALDEWSPDIRSSFADKSSASFEQNLRRIKTYYKTVRPSVRATTFPGRVTGDIEGSTCSIIFRSKAMEKTLSLAKKVAPKDSTVLLLGETGTGKEVFARYIHAMSGRSESPFIAVNCAALPPTLLESELFGHVRGAFTGADTDKKGLFEEAGRGTIFLDEIGDLPLEIQAKLLRVLQQKEVRPVGGVRDIAVNSRVIAATNRDLRQLLRESGFREDLYFRLAVFPITLVPLRERREDIALLARHFLEKIDQENNGISENSLRMLETCHWTGNVRELENWMEYAAIMAEGDVIRPEHFPDTGDQETLNETMFVTEDLPTYEEMGRRYIKHVLDMTGNNKKEASRILNIGTSTLWRHLKKEGDIQS